MHGKNKGNGEEKGKGKGEEKGKGKGKEDPVLKTYLLKDIDESIWDKFAIRARTLRMNIKETMNILVTQFANGDIDLRRNE